MQHCISTIHGRSAGIDRLQIDLNGKDLILTGPNGSGKTLLLGELYDKTKRLVAMEWVEDYVRKASKLTDCIEAQKVETRDYMVTEWVHQIRQLEAELEFLGNNLNIDIINAEELSDLYKSRKAVILKFEASRIAKIENSEGAKSLELSLQGYKNHGIHDEWLYANTMEQHLVNLYNRRSHAITEDGDLALAQEIKEWFELFDDNLKVLMEDETAHLEFNSRNLTFKIVRANKPAASFQNLSSGYSAIFAIYSELLMRTQYFDVRPDELCGIVFIDEIEVHLHVSLQRLVFPFLKKSFPKIQFVLTTHSPFIITSRESTVIYDVERNQAIDEDLTLYSYASVMEGLLGTRAISLELETLIKDLANETNLEAPNVDKLAMMVSKIQPSERLLDAQSRAYFLKARSRLIDLQQEGDDQELESV